MLFAAMQPERVNALVLLNTSSRYLEADDYPFGVPQTKADAIVRHIGALWGTEEFLTIINPERPDDAENARHGRTETAGLLDAAQPAAQLRYIMENLDVRSVLHLGPGADAGSPLDA